MSKKHCKENRHPGAPPIRQQRPQMIYREGKGHYWPEGEEMPSAYVVRPPLPCPECRCVKQYNTHQAVICRGQSNGHAHMICRECGHTWKWPLV